MHKAKSRKSSPTYTLIFQGFCSLVILFHLQFFVLFCFDNQLYWPYYHHFFLSSTSYKYLSCYLPHNTFPYQFVFELLQITYQILEYYSYPNLIHLSLFFFLMQILEDIKMQMLEDICNSNIVSHSGKSFHWPKLHTDSQKSVT